MSAPGGVCSQKGALGMSAPGECLLQGASAPGGLLWGSVSFGGRVCSWGGWLLPGGGIPACTESDTPPLTE